MRYFVAVALLLTACSAPEAGLIARRDKTLDDLGQHLTSGVETRFACNARTDAIIEQVLTLNVRQCWSCRNLGYLLRRVQQDAEADAGFLIVSSPADADRVCDFLRDERVRMPVAIVDSTLLPDSDRFRDPIVADFKAGALTFRAYVDRRLTSLDADGDGGESAARDSSQEEAR